MSPEQEPFQQGKIDQAPAPPQKVPGLEETAKEVHRVLNMNSINFQQIEEKIDSPEKAEQFKAFAKHIIKNLPLNEQADFAQNPVTFTSDQILFRGLDPQKYQQIKRSGTFETQSGQLGTGTGVFLSNSPYSAFTYQDKGCIAMLDRDSITYATDEKIVKLGSEKYKNLINNYLNSLPPSERRLAAYTVEDNWDLEEPVKGKGYVKIIALRKAQPIQNTKVFLNWTDQGIKEEYPLEAQQEAA